MSATPFEQSSSFDEIQKSSLLGTNQNRLYNPIANFHRKFLNLNNENKDSKESNRFSRIDDDDWIENSLHKPPPPSFMRSNLSRSKPRPRSACLDNTYMLR